MRRKDWQNLHDELTSLNEDFKASLSVKQEVKNRKQKKEACERLTYIMQLAFARITGNDKAYDILVADVRKDEALIKAKLTDLSDEDAFSDTLHAYLEKIKEKF